MTAERASTVAPPAVLAAGADAPLEADSATQREIATSSAPGTLNLGHVTVMTPGQRFEGSGEAVRLGCMTVDASDGTWLSGSFTITAVDAQGAAHSYSLDPLNEISLLPQPYTVKVAVPGYRELAREIDLTGHAGQFVSERFALVPRALVALEARTLDGRPFTELAQELGVDAAELFGGSFHAWESSIGPDASGAREIGRRFDDARRFIDRSESSVRDHGDVAGLLRGSEQASWIGLAFHERILSWNYVASDAEEAVYEIGIDDLRSALSRLTFRVVDARTREALTGAAARIETHSGLHLPAYNSLDIDPNGRAELFPMSPGSYTLVISADERQEFRAPIEIQRAIELDLGTIALDVAQPLRVRVVDRDGHPMTARVHIGPYVEGGSADRMLSPRFTCTDESGIALLAAPSQLSVVRAVASDSALALPDIKSRVIVVDPAHLPGTLEIAIRETTLIEIVCTGAKSRARAEILVESDGRVVIERRSDESMLVFLQPGPYRAVALDAAGLEIAARAFEVIEGQRATIELP